MVFNVAITVNHYSSRGACVVLLMHEASVSLSATLNGCLDQWFVTNRDHYIIDRIFRLKKALRLHKLCVVVFKCLVNDFVHAKWRITLVVYVLF